MPQYPPISLALDRLWKSLGFSSQPRGIDVDGPIGVGLSIGDASEVAGGGVGVGARHVLSRFAFASPGNHRGILYRAGPRGSLVKRLAEYTGPGQPLAAVIPEGDPTSGTPATPGAQGMLIGRYPQLGHYLYWDVSSASRPPGTVTLGRNDRLDTVDWFIPAGGTFWYGAAVGQACLLVVEITDL